MRNYDTYEQSVGRLSAPQAKKFFPCNRRNGRLQPTFEMTTAVGTLGLRPWRLRE